MIEYCTEALVLDKEPIGDQDMRVILFTRDLGRVSAKATSARKITSKLNGHLEPLNLVRVRLVDKNSLQVADALQIGRLPRSFLATVHLIKELNVDRQADLGLWNLIKSGELSDEMVLVLAGFDSRLANCEVCQSKKGLKFFMQNLEYRCEKCFDRK